MSNRPDERLLETLDDVILKNRGAVHEGDIFSTLSESPFIVRAFEFAPADGAIDCTREMDPSTSFASRFWDTDQNERDPRAVSSELVLFDVKGKISEVASLQRHLTTHFQQSLVAFYLCVCVADPAMVDLFPNYAQGMPPPTGLNKRDNVTGVNTSREAYQTPWAYRLDPSSAPYRMPLSLLPEAIRRIRRCAKGLGDYVNPWTLVPFPGWRPATHTIKYLKPAEHTQHFSAHKAAMEIFRLVKTHKPSAIELDFVGLQPRLADFKLILRNPDDQTVRQVFVQHKLDVRSRAYHTPLTRVNIGRLDAKGEASYYFNDHERFDFLFYQFENISVGTGKPLRVDLFFLPESLLPDTFYNSVSIEETFEREEFRDFRMHMDKDGHWVDRMVEIIKAFKRPRQETARPRRPGGHPARRSAADTSRLPKPLHKSLAGLASKELQGRQAYDDIMTYSHRLFFLKIMTQCAHRGSGLLFVLATEHPVGDYGFCRYIWTAQEQQDFLASRRIPKTVSDISGIAPTLPIAYYARHLESVFDGSDLASANFRRLNSCKDGRLLIWNVSGPDDPESPGPLFVIPSDDLQPTSGQRVALAKNLGLNKKINRSERTPVVSALLSTGLHASEYAVASRGPLIYSKHENIADWDALWELFDRFTRSQPVQHPHGTLRRPRSYVQPLWKIHQRLVQEDNRELRNKAGQKRKAYTPELKQDGQET